MFSSNTLKFQSCSKLFFPNFFQQQLLTTHGGKTMFFWILACVLLLLKFRLEAKGCTHPAPRKRAISCCGTSSSSIHPQTSPTLIRKIHHHFKRGVSMSFNWTKRAPNAGKNKIRRSAESKPLSSLPVFLSPVATSCHKLPKVTC